MLVNVPRPEEIVAEAVRLARPGGTVAFHEADALTEVCDPPLEAWTQLRNLLNRYAELNGIDLFVGRRLPRLLRDAGLVALVVSHLYIQAWGRKPHGEASTATKT